jgi:Amiloride-sensitive sodium channel
MTSKSSDDFTSVFARSSIHGVQYLFDPGTPKKAKIFWLIVLSVSSLLYALCIYKLVYKFSSEPEIGISISRKPIGDIHFPAITICPEIKARKSVFDFRNVYDLMHQKHVMKIDNVSIPDTDLRYFYAMNQICMKIFKTSPDQNENEDDIVGNLKKFQYGRKMCIGLAAPKSISLEGRDYLLTETLTHEGICVTFNLDRFENVFENSDRIDENLRYEYEFLKGPSGLDIENESYPFRITTQLDNRYSV